MVTMLNEFNPRSDDAAASSLMKALTALLPAMFGDELGFLVSLGCFPPCTALISG